MNLSTLDFVFWAAGVLGHAALFSVLVLRRRFREFPVFTTFVAFNGLRSLALYAVYLRHSRVWYGRAYWTFAVLDFCLQLGVVWEIVRIVMRPTRTWVRDAKALFLFSSAVAFVVAAVFASMMSPPGENPLQRLGAWANLFTSFLICELFIVMLLTAKWLGLGFRNHVFALVVGWSNWVMAVMLIDLLIGYYGNHIDFVLLGNAKKLVYLAALVYWMVRFWLNEPARPEIAPELREYIVKLHRRVKNDLDSFE